MAGPVFSESGFETLINSNCLFVSILQLLYKMVLCCTFLPATMLIIYCTISTADRKQQEVGEKFPKLFSRPMERKEILTNMQLRRLLSRLFLVIYREKNLKKIKKLGSRDIDACKNHEVSGETHFNQSLCI